MNATASTNSAEPTSHKRNRPRRKFTVPPAYICNRGRLSHPSRVAGLGRPQAQEIGQVPYGLLNELRTKTAEFCVCDRSCLLQTIELLYLVSGAETNDTAKLITSLLNLLGVPFGHPSPLCDQVHKHGEQWEYDERYHPDCFAPARDIMTPEQVHEHSDEQPDCHHEDEYCEGIDQEVAERETFVDEEHRDPPCLGARPAYSPKFQQTLGLRRSSLRLHPGG